MPALPCASRDITVNLLNKEYLAKKGDIYPLLDKTVDSVTFTVEGQEITVPTNAGEVASSEKVLAEQDRMQSEMAASSGARRAAMPALPGQTPAEITKAAQMEAVRRYPGIGIKGSPENQLFVTAVKEQKFAGENEFFSDPKWPLVLAEILAEKEKWPRADQVEVSPEAAGNTLPLPTTPGAAGGR